jgi:hypothetical protein
MRLFIHGWAWLLPNVAWKERASRGVPIDPVIQQELCMMRNELRLPYQFPFEA